MPYYVINLPSFVRFNQSKAKVLLLVFHAKWILLSSYSGLDMSYFRTMPLS